MTQDHKSVYAKFEIRAVEDREETIRRGYNVKRDADFALLYPKGDKHTVLEVEVNPATLAEWRGVPHKAFLVDEYQAWKDGQEEPLHGIPLSQWPQITPSQVRMAEAISVRTVEDFANLNDTGLMHFGAGGMTLKQKAKAYLEAASGPGKAAEQLSAMQSQIQMMQEQMQQLKEANEAKDKALMNALARDDKTAKKKAAEAA